MKNVIGFFALVFLNSLFIAMLAQPARIDSICNGSAVLPSQWTLLGPAQMPLHEIGKITAIAALPSEPDIVYAGGSYGGGLFRTTDAAAGASPKWQCITDQQRFKTGQICDIEIVPSLNEHSFHDLYFSCELGVFKSVDNGITWTQSLKLTNSFDDRKLLMHPTNYKTLYVIAETNEIYKTIDGGEHWQPLQLKTFLDSLTPPVPNEKIWNIILNPLNPDVLYASGQAAHFFRFDPTLPGPLAQQWIDIKSTLTTGPVPPASTSEWFRLSAAGNNIYTLCKNKNNSPQIYISSDGGYTWNAHQQSNLIGARFLVSPQQNVMYIGDNPGGSCCRRVNKSVNGGKDFFSVSQYSPKELYHGVSTHGDIRAMKLIDPSPSVQDSTGSTDFLLVGDDGGVLYSHSSSMNGLTPVVNWTDLNGSGLCVTEFHGIGGYEQDPELIIGGSQDDDIFKYDHGNWSTNVLCDGYECVIDPANPLIVYGQKDCGYGTRLFQSSDGGKNWINPFTSIPESGGGRKPMIINKTNNHFYIAYHNLFKSLTPTPPDYQLVLNKPECKISDFSSSPFNVPASWPVGAFDVCENFPDTIYYGFGGPSLGDAKPLSQKLFKTIDGGASWNDITDFSNNHELAGVRRAVITGIAMNQENSDEVYVSFDGTWETTPGSGIGVNRVMRSNDGGQTWSDYSTGLREFNVYTLKFQKGANILYASTWIGVFARRTDDPNSQWECFNKDLPVTAVTDLEINYCSQKIRSATYGRGLWESSLASAATTLTGSQTWSTPHQLVTDLVIPKGSILTINTEVDIAKGRTITVIPGGKLILSERAHLFNGCKEKWNRIDVRGTAKIRKHRNAIIEGNEF